MKQKCKTAKFQSYLRAIIVQHLGHNHRSKVKHAEGS